MSQSARDPTMWNSLGPFIAWPGDPRRRACDHHGVSTGRSPGADPDDRPRPGESPRWHDGRLWFATGSPARSSRSTTTGASRGDRPAPVAAAVLRLPARRPARLVSGPARGAAAARRPTASLATYADLSALSPSAVQRHRRRRARQRLRQQPQLRRSLGGPPPRATSPPGSSHWSRPDGAARVVAEDIAFPNGMAVTAGQPDADRRRVLPHRLTAFDHRGGRRALRPPGLGRPRRRVRRTASASMREGAVWYADVPHQHCVRVRRGRRGARRPCELDRGAFACMLGGADGRDPVRRRRPLARDGRHRIRCVLAGSGAEHRGRDARSRLAGPDLNRRRGRWPTPRTHGWMTTSTRCRTGSRRSASEVRDLVARGRPGGHRDDQADGPAVLRPRRQHLRAAGRQGPRQRVPVRRRHRARPGRHHHRRARQQDRPHGRHPRGRADQRAGALTAMFRQIIANNRAGGWRKLKRAT